MQIPTMPFKILAVGPFLPGIENLWPDGPIRVDKSHLDETLKEFGLTLDIPVPRELCLLGELTVSINKFKDFHPDLLMENTPVLKNLSEARRFLEEAKPRGLSDEEIYTRLKGWPDLPPQIRFEPLKTRPDSRSSVDDILNMVVFPG